MSSAASGKTGAEAAAMDGGDRAGLWCRVGCGEVCEEGVVGLARDVALEAAEDLALALPFGGAAGGVGAGALAVAQSADRDHVQRPVRVAITAVVKAVAQGLARGRGDRA